MYNYYNDNMFFGNLPYWYKNNILMRNSDAIFDFPSPYINDFNPMFLMNSSNHIPTYNSFKNINQKVLNLNNLFRRLWFEHAIWTKLAVTAIANAAPNTEVVSERLLRNPDDFYEAFLPIYGQTVADQFRLLLKEHLQTAAKLINAMRKKDNNSYKTLENNWFKNADDISNFLSRINPYWDRESMRKMMYEHLNQILALAESVLKNNYKDSIIIYDNLQRVLLEMADVFVMGILRQFPNKF